MIVEPKYNVLWVEDDESWAKPYVMGLERRGIAVDLIADGEKAILASQNSVYHVVIIDHELRGMDGLRVLKRLYDDQRTDRPILVISGEIEKLPDRDKILKEYYKYQPLEYIPKIKLEIKSFVNKVEILAETFLA